MFLRFEDNLNTGFVDDRVFQERTEPKPVTHVLRRMNGAESWCPIIGVTKNKIFKPALARKVEDSGEGACYLVYGGLWGLRLKQETSTAPWSLEDESQWSEPFLLLAADGMDIRFA